MLSNRILFKNESYQFQTLQDYSFSSLVPFEKQSNSIINSGTPVRPFKHDDYVIFNQSILFLIGDRFQFLSSSVTWKFDGDSNSDIYFTSNDSLDHCFFIKQRSLNFDIGVYIH